MSLPASHPEVDAKSGKTCPVTGESHDFQPPAEGDSRSVCPALNTMANHGYIRRDGKNLSMLAVYRGLKACYGLSSPLAAVLVTGGWLLIKRIGRISLFDIGLHNGVEHDASVVHLDTPPGEKYAPIEIQPDLVDDFAAHVVAAAGQVSEAEALVTAHDIVQTRLRRERLSKPLDAKHAEIARGEFSIILGVWNRTPTGAAEGRGEGVPLPWMRTWLRTERLPDGWRPDHVETLHSVVKRSSAMRAEMKKIREAEAEAAKHT
ncbi:Chloroperoxidase [Mycena vitilis]|nr:Chloroperoxidase [Mycena vitilis]